MDSNLPGIVSLIKSAWQRVKPRYGSLLLVMILPTIIIFGIEAFLFAPTIIAGAMQSNSEILILLQVFTGILAFIAIPAIIFLSLWSQTALLYAISLSHQWTLKEAFKKSLPLVLPFVWIIILASLSTITGFIALIVPGFLIGIYTWFSPFILVTGEARGLNCLVLSREYVRGIFWKTLGRILAPLVIFILFYSFIIAVIFTQENPAIVTVTGLGYWVVVFLITPILIGYYFELYLSVKHHAGAVIVTSKQRRWFGVLAALGVVAVPLLFTAILVGLITLGQQNSEWGEYEGWENYNNYEEDGLLDDVEPNI